MACPVCNGSLEVMDRRGVEIDYCPVCLRVWFDRVEVDWVLDRLASPSRGEPGGSSANRSEPSSWLPARRRRRTQACMWAAEVERT
ncbi:MAG: zf-TFIIB domain-containing protein [Acidimicrobiia bacterium]